MAAKKHPVAQAIGTSAQTAASIATMLSLDAYAGVSFEESLRRLARTWTPAQRARLREELRTTLRVLDEMD